MRTARILGQGRSFYHCMSRVVDRRFIFGAEEKEFFRKTMRQLEAFLGVRVVTYALMSNHFHLLLEVPARPMDDEEVHGWLTPEELLRRLPFLYDEPAVREVREELERAAAAGSERWVRQILAPFERRMLDLSVFLKELKQRFTQWYNRRKKRRGTLWEERFKSVLVEDCEEALLLMAAYIDINPVRAGLADDPKDYRWCGYGEAVAGGALARKGLCRILEAAGEVTSPPGERYRAAWRLTTARYRLLLYRRGEENHGDEFGRGIRRGFSVDEIELEEARNGLLSCAEALRCRVRYLCDGAVLGTSEFVENVFQANRERFGPRRKEGPRPMRGADWGELCVIRDLRLRAIETS